MWASFQFADPIPTKIMLGLDLGLGVLPGQVGKPAGNPVPPTWDSVNLKGYFGGIDLIDKVLKCQIGKATCNSKSVTPPLATLAQFPLFMSWSLSLETNQFVSRVSIFLPLTWLWTSPHWGCFHTVSSNLRGWKGCRWTLPLSACSRLLDQPATASSSCYHVHTF